MISSKNRLCKRKVGNDFGKMKAFQEMESVPESVKMLRCSEKGYCSEKRLRGNEEGCCSVEKVAREPRKYCEGVSPRPSHLQSVQLPASRVTFAAPTAPGCPATYASCPRPRYMGTLSRCSTWNTPFHCFKRRFSCTLNRHDSRSIRTIKSKK